VTFISSLLLLLLLSPAAPSETVVSSDSPLIGSIEERRGDFVQWQERWLREIQADPESNRSGFMMVRWSHVFSRANRSVPSALDWQKIADACQENGWNRGVASALAEAVTRETGAWLPPAKSEWSAAIPGKWWAIGPIGDAIATELTVARPDIENFDRNVELSWRERTRSWFPLPEPLDRNVLRLRSSFSGPGAAVYLRSRFSIDRDEDALLRILCSTSYKVWVDGREVLISPRHREHSSLRQGVGLHLARGEHVILIKLAPGNFGIRFRRSDGSPLEVNSLGGEKEGATADSRVIPFESKGNFKDAWLLAWEKEELPLDEQFALCLTLAGLGDFVRCEEVWLSIDHQEDPVASALVRREIPFPWIPGDLRRHERATIRDEALTLDPAVLPLLLDDARIDYSDGKAIEAMTAIEKILDMAPCSVETLLFKHRIAKDRSWHFEKKESLGELNRCAPEIPAVLEASLELAIAEHRTRDALELALTLTDRGPTQANVDRCARLLRRSGKISEAVRLLDRWRNLAGDVPATLLFLAEHAEESGSFKEAHSLYSMTFPTHPDDTRPLEGLLRCALATGDDPEPVLRGLHQVKPGNIRTTRTLERLAGDSTDDFWKPYSRSFDEIIADAPELGAYPDAMVVLLFDQMVTLVGPGGQREMTHQVLRIESQQGIEQLSELPVPGRILKLRVITPDGRELHPTAGSGQRAYTLPGLEPGALVEMRAIRYSDLSRRELFSAGPFFFVDPQFQNAFHRSEWVLLTPRDWAPVFEDGGDPPEPQIEIVDNHRVIRWSVDEKARPQPERLMPPAQQILPNVAVSMPITWETVLPGILASNIPDDRPTPRLRHHVETLLEGIEGNDARFDKLRDAVCERIPDSSSSTSATETWLKRSGDRDLALAGMMRCADLPLDWVLVGERDDFNPWQDFSSPRKFQFTGRVLRRLEEGRPPQAVSAQMRFAKADRIPSRLRGAPCLALPPAEASWDQIPAATPGEDAQQLDIQVTITGEKVLARGALEIRNISGSRLKEQIRGINPFVRNTILERFVQQLFPGARLLEGSFENQDSRTEPLRITFTIDAPHLLQSRPEGSSLQLTFLPANLRKAFIGRGERTFPIFARAETEIIENVEVVITGDDKILKAPESITLNAPWGNYSFNVEKTDEGIRIERVVRLRPFLQPPDRLDDLVDFAVGVDEKEQERLLIGDGTP